ncbi:hypothetical protein EYF80_007459 [Liparis tanakae]|uniref:Uncharacterized protein n=1 Tax=Liparis tanakae TaxID=230148 RepID=A0A4Z2IXY4_9TELE|nr:hypothetical protein EYF80_007459 [Liparis tanakae]
MADRVRVRRGSCIGPCEPSLSPPLISSHIPPDGTGAYQKLSAAMKLTHACLHRMAGQWRDSAQQGRGRKRTEESMSEEASGMRQRQAMMRV